MAVSWQAGFPVHGAPLGMWDVQWGAPAHTSALAELRLCLDTDMALCAACFWTALFLRGCSDLGHGNLVFGLILSG